MVKGDKSGGGLYQGIFLFKRGNYSMLRLLTIINASGSEGITTRKLLDTIGSHATYTQKVIDKAKKLKLIERKIGEEPGPGQFAPVYNIITDKGRQLLLLQFRFPQQENR